jgi:hypothetical protein
MRPGLIERVYADETRPWLQGLASDRLGIGAGWDSGDAAGGWSGGGADAGGQSALGHCRRGSDRRQRRCRQQDRHLSSGGGRALSRRAVHGGGAGFDGGYEPDQRNAAIPIEQRAPEELLTLADSRLRRWRRGHGIRRSM